MTSYLFYDLETTGLNPAFDQVLSFAAIRTDMTLREIKRHTMEIRLRYDIIPSPEAILTHGIGIFDMAEGQCEFEAVSRIHRLLNTPGTISIGYNTLGFDDEVLRFSFHRNLLPPYTHQYDKGCQRMDVYPMVIPYYLYKPETIKWPQIDGRTSLKLEDLSAANSLSDGPAHSAIVDVEATVELARRLQSHRDMWDFLSGYFHKSTDQIRLQKIEPVFESSEGRHRMGLMIAGEFGHDQSFQAPVLSIGQSDAYSNQTLWLRLDLPELPQTTFDNITENTWVVRKKLGEPGFVLPPLPRYWSRLPETVRGQVEYNLKWLTANPDLFLEIIRYHREYRYPEVPDVDTDAALYTMGFLSYKEQDACRRFHLADLGEKVKLADRFERQELKTLARRMIMRNYPEKIPGKWNADITSYNKRINAPTQETAMVDFKGMRRNTPSETRKNIQRLMADKALGSGKVKLLEELRQYIDVKFPPQE